MHEETQAIAPTGPATTEFHVSKPDGWPTGGYTLKILLDGVPVRTASFRVGKRALTRAGPLTAR